jgi:transcriptional regulator with XRE-family HTH domain
MKSVKFLESVRATLEKPTDAEVAKALNLSKGAISHYLSGRRVMDNETCIAVALHLGIDPVKIIMAADIDRAERAGQQSLWEVFTRRTSIAASVLAMVLVNLFLTPNTAEAVPRLALSSTEQVEDFVLCQIMEKLRAVLAAVKRWFFGRTLEPATA